MPYDVTLIDSTSVTGSPFRYGGSAPAMNFPSSAFDNIVYSQWSCGGISVFPAGQTVGIGPSFISASTFFSMATFDNSVLLGNASGQFFSGHFAPGVVHGQRSHVLVSVNTAARALQVYVNDIAQTITGAWTGSLGSNHFLLSPSTLTIDWPVENVISAGIHPAIADIWCGVPTSFVDMSVTANRRRFINADLSPVYLGTDGSAPLGFQPQIYCTIPAGGVPTDIRTNHGTGTSFFSDGGVVLTFQAPGICTLPAPPPVLLTLDNVLVTAAVPNVAGDQIFLDWSDTRGKRWGDPVAQPIGRRGKYLTSPQWQRLGYGRDRVFRLTWSVPVKTALQGAFVEADTTAKS